MNSNEIAFFIGLFGSVHCIGMCGPLAFAVPSVHSKWWLVVADKVSYNMGRLLSYALLGFIIGLIGRQIWLSGLQRGVSLVSGLLIIMAGLSRLLKIRLSHSTFLSAWLYPVNQLLNYALNIKPGTL